MRDADERSFRAVGEEIGHLLQHAKDRAREIEKNAEEDAAVLLAAAREDAAGMIRTAQRTVAEAETTATVIAAQAKRAAADVAKDAANAARKLLKDAEIEASARVAQIERRIIRLQQVEAVLRDRLKAQGPVSAASPKARPPS